MAQIKTSELTGAALDWAVAKCEGYDKKGALKADKRRVLIPHPDGGGQLFQASTDWSQGGPIIEREQIGLTYSDSIPCWYATSQQGKRFLRLGETPLIAAMRCLNARFYEGTYPHGTDV